MPEITQDILKEYVAYDRMTGIFYHKKDSMAAKVGDIAGGKHNRGYLTLSIGGQAMLAHRAAWLYVFGYVPEKGLDHIDGDKKNNCIDNLREVSQSCNMKNYGNPKTNTSGIRGVYWDKGKDKWCAVIISEKKRYYLGGYSTHEEAVFARYAGEQALGWHECSRDTPSKKYIKEGLST